MAIGANEMTDRRFFQIEVGYAVAILLTLVWTAVMALAILSDIRELKQQMQTTCVEQTK